MLIMAFNCLPLLELTVRYCPQLLLLGADAAGERAAGARVLAGSEGDGGDAERTRRGADDQSLLSHGHQHLEELC